MTRKDINCCKKILRRTSLKNSYNGEGNYAGIIIYSPISFIEEVCKNNDLEEHTDEIKELLDKILKRKDILISFKPLHVACATVKRFCERRMISSKNLCRNNDVSENSAERSGP